MKDLEVRATESLYHTGWNSNGHSRLGFQKAWVISGLSIASYRNLTAAFKWVASGFLFGVFLLRCLFPSAQHQTGGTCTANSSTPYQQWTWWINGCSLGFGWNTSHYTSPSGRNSSCVWLWSREGMLGFYGWRPVIELSMNIDLYFQPRLNPWCPISHGWTPNSMKDGVVSYLPPPAPFRGDGKYSCDLFLLCLSSLVHTFSGSFFRGHTALTDIDLCGESD